MPRIPDEVVERLKKEVDLAELVVRSGVALKKAGKDLVGRCPFHHDDTPSLVVTPAKGLWHCLGACQRGGTVIDWVMKAEGVSFRHAIELLRAKELPMVTGNVVTRSTVRRLPTPVEADAGDAEALSQVVAYYHSTLSESPEALSYLARRRLDDPETVEHFSLGFSNRTLGLRLPAKNRKEGAALRGRLERLGVFRASGHEHLRGSLVVPVIDQAGAVTDLYGRKINDHLRAGTSLHLYLPGPHRGVFNEEAMADGEVIVAESLIDALSFYAFGFQNVTAAYGTAGWTPAHDRALETHRVRRVLFAFDADEPGRRATTELAAALMTNGVECYAVSFPEGTDANDVARTAKAPRDAFGHLVRGARWLGKGSAPGRRPKAPDPPAPAPPVPSSAASPAATPAPEAEPGPVTERHGDELRVATEVHTWRVRGLGRAQHSDAARCNVMVTDVHGVLHVDTFDLYAARSRAAFCREAAAELGTDEAELRRQLGRVLLAVEQATEADQAAGPEHVEMTDAERTDAMALLCDPDLAARIGADVAALGVVGEERNALLCYLACVSRKCERPLGVLVQSASAAGKSTLADAVLALCPPEDAVSYSAMTGQSLFYLGRSDLSHKVLSISEEEGAARATYALKLLQSEGQLSIASAGKDPVTGKLVTHTYEVQGPVALLTTTTALDVDEELANRLVVVAVREDTEQTRAIHAAQRQALSLEGMVARQRRSAITARHRNAQRLLEALPVVVPGADSLSFGALSTRSRRDHAKYLGLICASALLHQHQRQIRTTDVDGTTLRYVEAAPADVALADRLADDVLVRDGSELTPAARRLLGALVEWAPAGPFTRRAAREALRVGDTQLKVHLHQLVALEYVVADRDGRSVTYELSVDAPGTTTPMRSGPEAIRSGEKTIRSASGRRAVGIRSGPSDGDSSQAGDHLSVIRSGFGDTRELGEGAEGRVEHVDTAALARVR